MVDVMFNCVLRVLLGHEALIVFTQVTKLESNLYLLIFREVERSLVLLLTFGVGLY